MYLWVRDRHLDDVACGSVQSPSISHDAGAHDDDGKKKLTGRADLEIELV